VSIKPLSSSSGVFPRRTLGLFLSLPATSCATSPPRSGMSLGIFASLPFTLYLTQLWAASVLSRPDNLSGRFQGPEALDLGAGCWIIRAQAQLSVA